MSVIIKGMKIPKNCGVCPCYSGHFCDFTDKFIINYDNKDDDCPLVEIPFTAKCEFRVGEEVYDHTIFGTGIVKNVENKSMVDILWNDGSVSESINIKDLEKTGRIFPEIIEFFNGG